MNDRMSDMDSLVDVAARAIYATRVGLSFSTRDIARGSITGPIRHQAERALLAVGLPALLERVEAAEGERDEATLLLDLIHSEIGPAEEVWRWNDGTLRGRIHELINGGEPSRSTVTAERDALAAKVADAWDEGREYASRIIRAVYQEDWPDIARAALSKADTWVMERPPFDCFNPANPYRTALDASETP